MWGRLAELDWRGWNLHQSTIDGPMRARGCLCCHLDATQSNRRTQPEVGAGHGDRVVPVILNCTVDDRNLGLRRSRKAQRQAENDEGRER
jgi:hypothetical protein